MSRHPFRLLVPALTLSSLLAACSAPPPSAQPPAAQVTVATLKTESVALTRELPGRTTPFLVAEVRPQVSGIVKRRLFLEGGLVNAGQPLYQLDDASYRADHAKTLAALARARATLVTARLNASRSAELARIDAVSKQDDENASAALRQAEADVNAAQAAVDGSSVVLAYARITAPISGRIGKSSVTQGALVTADQEAPLATVQQLDPMYVDVTQSSSELLQLRKELAAGTLKDGRDVPVTILLEDGTPYAYGGRLTFSDVTVDPTTGSFSMRVQVPNPDGLLQPGMYVRALVNNGIRDNALLVPQQAITRGPNGDATAMVVGAGNKVELREVRVSRAIDDRWLVESGLSAGDKVIIAGLQKIKPGVPVQATEAVPVGAKPEAMGAEAGMSTADAGKQE